MNRSGQECAPRYYDAPTARLVTGLNGLPKRVGAVGAPITGSPLGCQCEVPFQENRRVDMSKNLRDQCPALETV